MHKMIYRFSLALLALVLITGVQGVASAQQSSDKDITKTELQAFDKFLDAHPALASDIRQNPSVVNDPTYLKQHPELKGFLQNQSPCCGGTEGKPKRVHCSREQL